ncbi:MAG: SoxR reducing system RseC family protein [Bacteroidales bacterium]|jgi:positive regulator of sigma E activity|nr:SoxR reducing system RseC family protein [Bacteroidales bacterium]MDD4823560.1 SoxR reducing system RseC family protein [Bacteroidales bacterium]
MNESIVHEGVIDSVSEKAVKVKILQVSACSGCHAKGVCTSVDQKERIIEVQPDGNSYKLGEKVSLYGKRSWGLKAVFWAFFLPFVLIIASLILLSLLQLSELISGLFSLAVLIPYYIVLSLFKNQLKKSFSFTINKITN